jgi:hypothetical protein
MGMGRPKKIRTKIVGRAGRIVTELEDRGTEKHEDESVKEDDQPICWDEIGCLFFWQSR